VTNKSGAGLLSYRLDVGEVSLQTARCGVLARNTAAGDVRREIPVPRARREPGRCRHAPFSPLHVLREPRGGQRAARDRGARWARDPPRRVGARSQRRPCANVDVCRSAANLPCPRALARLLRLPGSSLGRLPTSCTCAGSRPHSPRTKWPETGSQRPKSPHGRITWPRVVSPSPRALAPFGRQSVPGESAPHLMCLNFVVGQSLCALWLRFTWRGRETLLLKAVVH
jgi:hypothetical protein